MKCVCTEFSCDTCDKIIPVGQVDLTEDNAGEKPYSCDLCQKSYYSSSELTQHKKSAEHLKKLELKNTPSPFASTSFIESGEAEINIEIKDKIILTSDNRIFIGGMELTEDKAGEKPYSCDLCKKSYYSISELSQHYKKSAGHLKKLEFIKNTVPSSASTSFVDCGIKPEIKDKISLTSDNTIKREREELIEDKACEKPYSCDLCEKSFLQLNHLTAHKMFHIGEKQFHCKLCQKSFCSNSDLSLHNRTASHLEMLHTSMNTVKPSTSTSFVDCVEAGIKLEIKEEETFDEDPLSINIEAENVKETIKQEIEEEEVVHKDCIDIIEHKIEI